MWYTISDNGGTVWSSRCADICDILAGTIAPTKGVK